MECFRRSCAALLLLLAVADANRNPAVQQVVALLGEMKSRIELDGQMEQKSYDKYACWCEDSLGRKAKDISKAKELIDELQSNIIKLKSGIAAHAAEIEQLKKDIKGNLESQREATETREAEFAEYEKEKLEAEQCIGALEAATKVLTGAGTGKKFLEVFQEAQLLSVVAGVRGVINRPAAMKKISEQDLTVVRRFVDSPDDFVGGRSDLMSATQIKHNPFGDYAPQSTQIQGILKGMYDAFTLDLEKDNADESDSQKSYEAFMATKKAELNTLELTLETQSKDKADKTVELAQSRERLDDTKVQLAADEEFFADTKSTCEMQARGWSERVRLRTEELQGVGKAIQILGSEDSQAIFHNSSTTFVQLSATVHRHRHLQNKVEDADVQKARDDAFNQLKTLATHLKNTKIARIAVDVKNGGHFDKMLTIIDDMIAVLRKEEQDDIAHRDRCKNAEAKNANDKEDAESGIAKANATIGRLKDEEKDLKDKIDDLRDDIKASQNEKNDMLQLRNKEESDFKQALYDDQQAVDLLDQAMVSLQQFYKNNKMPLALVRSKKANPEYSEDADKAPELMWQGKDYGGHEMETTGLVAIIGMIKEDIVRQMQSAREGEKEAQKEYIKQDKALTKVMDADTTAKISTEKELSEVEDAIADKDKTMDQRADDKKAEEELAKALEKDCDWVKNHFEDRRDKRKAEIAGLQEAKGYLAGVDDGSDLTFQTN